MEREVLPPAACGDDNRFAIENNTGVDLCKQTKGLGKI